ncbi:hypothetical protein QE152_g9752 [Popillia japonica]|uniref:Ig-like domain-containing protein n=1 Tax=Popillia japonica TaxID=7064 RepID=A0AAW1LVS6_POPJA
MVVVFRNQRMLITFNGNVTIQISKLHFEMITSTRGTNLLKCDTSQLKGRKLFDAASNTPPPVDFPTSAKSLSFLSKIPPKKIVITDENGSELTSVVGPFSEGASFNLKCDVFGGKPLPTVLWLRNDIPETNASVVLPSAGTTHVRSELRILGLTRQDVHSELTCQAYNNPKTQPLASTLHVDMNCQSVFELKTCWVVDQSALQMKTCWWQMKVDWLGCGSVRTSDEDVLVADEGGLASMVFSSCHLHLKHGLQYDH